MGNDARRDRLSRARKIQPDRFLAGDNEDRTLAVFGFGRRICPGLHTAQDSLFILAASMVAAFDFLPICDTMGNPRLPMVNYTTGMISHPEQFKCQIIPRSKEIIPFIEERDRKSVV